MIRFTANIDGREVIATTDFDALFAGLRLVAEEADVVQITGDITRVIRAPLRKATVRFKSVRYMGWSKKHIGVSHFVLWSTIASIRSVLHDVVRTV